MRRIIYSTKKLEKPSGQFVAGTETYCARDFDEFVQAAHEIDDVAVLSDDEFDAYFDEYRNSDDLEPDEAELVEVDDVADEDPDLPPEAAAFEARFSGVVDMNSDGSWEFADIKWEDPADTQSLENNADLADADNMTENLKVVLQLKLPVEAGQFDVSGMAHIVYDDATDYTSFDAEESFIDDFTITKTK